MSTLRTNNLQNPDSSSVNIELTQNGGAIFSGVTTVSSNLNVTGVLTYEDVTNIDSIGVVTARSSINIGASGNPHGKLHVYTDSLNADNGYNGQNFGIVVETEDGNNDGDEGNGICFTQQYSADGIDSGKVRTGAIIGFKDQSSGNFGGGLKFKVQQAGATPLLTSMTLDKSGNIGIGTDNPTTKLSILIGNETDLGSGSNGLIIYDGTKNAQLSRTGSSYSYGGVTGTGSLVYSYDKLSLLADTSNPITFATGGSERLRILSGGQVNIGGNYTQTTYQLQVDGGIKGDYFVGESLSNRTGFKYGASGMFTLTLGGSRGGNASSFTMFEVHGMNNTKFFEIMINFGHAGGGVHGSYRRYAGFSNGYTSIQTLEDSGNVNYGGGLGFSITKPDSDTVRVVWNGANNYADAFTLACQFKTSNAGAYFKNVDSAFS